MGDENAANKAEPAAQEEQACPICASVFSGVSDAGQEAGASQRRGDPPPPAPLPLDNTPLAALSGAVGCLLAAALSSVAVQLLMGTWPVLVDLIVGAIAATFGAIRGVRHAHELGLGARTYREIAWMAVEDMDFLAHPGTFEWEKLVSLIVAVILVLPLVAVLLVLWFALTNKA